MKMHYPWYQKLIAVVLMLFVVLPLFVPTFIIGYVVDYAFGKKTYEELVTSTKWYYRYCLWYLKLTVLLKCVIYNCEYSEMMIYLNLFC